MTTSRGFGLNGQALYTNITKPMVVSMQFTVAATNGLGVTSLKSNGYVNNVFMHTSTTPSANNGFTNPNPAAGYAIVQLKQNFNKFIGISGQALNPPSATSTKIDNSALTAGLVYTISTVGDASTAVWRAVGVPAGVTPAVGVAFTALTVGAGSNVLTSRVMIPGVSGVSSIEVVGDPNADQPSPIATNAGQQVFLQFCGATSSSVTTNIPVAPLAGSIVSLSLLFDGSTVTIDGL